MKKKITIEIVCDEKIADEVDRTYRMIIVDADSYYFKKESIREEAK